MEWINANWEPITAMIGAAYVAIRIAVVLTPTKKDDEILAQADGWWKKIVVILSKVAGLDVKQGIKTK